MQVISEVDTDGLGTLNMQEFRTVMQLSLGWCEGFRVWGEGSNCAARVCGRAVHSSFSFRLVIIPGLILILGHIRINSLILTRTITVVLTK